MANIDSVKLPNGNEYGIAGGSQPNLLINPWFTVNQRGVSSFTGSYDDVKAADRWLTRRASGSVNSNGITFAWDGAHSSNGLLTTHIEDNPDLFGKTVTLSALVNGNIISYSFTLNDNETKNVGDNNEFYIDTKNLAGAIIINYYNYTTTAVTVRAMKLEKGSTSTLHLDTAPDYTTELLKCQRHLKRIEAPSTNFPVFIGTVVTSSRAKFVAPLTVPMRTTAIVTTSGTFSILSGATQENVTSIALSDAGNDSVVFNADVASSLTVGNAVILCFVSSGAYIDFSAEL